LESGNHIEAARITIDDSDSEPEEIPDKVPNDEQL